MTDKEVMQMALQKIKYMLRNGEWYEPEKAIEALEAALARPELVTIAERNQTWAQDHWTEYERKIAAAEREACAQVADEWNDAYALLIAEAIRARGNT